MPVGQEMPTNLPSSLDYLSRFHNTKLVYVATTVNVMKKYYGPSPSVFFSLESFVLFASDCLSFLFEFLLDFYCRFQVLSCETMSAAEWPISPQPIIFLASRSIFLFLNRPIAERLLTINVSYLLSGGQILTLVFLRSPSLASCSMPSKASPPRPHPIFCSAEKGEAFDITL